MKDSEIVWAARERINRGWCQRKSTDENGSVCALSFISFLRSATSRFRIASALRDTLNGRSVLLFNDDLYTTKQDVLDLFEKTAIRLEESGL